MDWQGRIEDTVIGKRWRKKKMERKRRNRGHGQRSTSLERLCIYVWMYAALCSTEKQASKSEYAGVNEVQSRCHDYWHLCRGVPLRRTTETLPSSCGVVDVHQSQAGCVGFSWLRVSVPALRGFACVAWVCVCVCVSCSPGSVNEGVPVKRWWWRNRS